MRILLVGDYPADPRLGSTKVPMKLQQEFRALGHTCDVLLGPDIGLRPRNRHLRQALAPVAAAAAVERAFQEHGPYDVIDAASAEALWLPALRRLGRLGRAAIVARSNGLEHLNYRRMLDDHDAGLLAKPASRRLWYPAVRLSQVAAAARAADRLILLNAGDRAFAEAHRWKPSCEIAVVPHGVSTAFLDSPGAAGPRGLGILFCGTWDHAKGVRYVADAFSALVDGGRTVNMTILGGGVAESTIRGAFSPRAQQHLTVRDRVPEAEVMAAYRAHDVLAFASSYEGFGMVLLEAMTQRLPVVATPVGCARSLVQHERTGLLVPARDSAALAAALARILDDPPLGRTLASSAVEQVRSMTWTRTAEATLAVYASALTDHAGR